MYIMGEYGRLRGVLQEVAGREAIWEALPESLLGEGSPAQGTEKATLAS